MNIQEIISGLQRKIALQSNYITFYEAELIKSYSNNCEYSDGLKWELSYLRAEQTLDKRTLGMLIGQNKMIGSLSKLICVKQRRESFLYRECIKSNNGDLRYLTWIGKQLAQITEEGCCDYCLRYPTWIDKQLAQITEEGCCDY